MRSPERAWARARVWAHSFAVDLQALGDRVLGVDRPLPVLELAHVVVAAGTPSTPSVRCQPRKMSLLACMSRWPATTRAPWLAYWLFLVKRSRTDASASLAWRNRTSSWLGAVQQDDPGPGADAAHADHLAGHLAELVLLEQVPAVGRQALAVPAQELAEQLTRAARHSTLGKELLDRDDERRIADDAALAVDHRGQLVERLHAVLRPRLGDQPSSPSPPCAPRAFEPEVAAWACSARRRPPTRRRGSTRPRGSTWWPSGASPPGRPGPSADDRLGPHRLGEAPARGRRPRCSPPGA